MHTSGTVRAESPDDRPADTGSSVSISIFRFIALAGIPLSLSSPGATVSMGLVGFFGLYRMIKGDRLDPDIRRLGFYMLGCYLLLVIVDFLNGGGLVNVETTAVNYLPIVALAPYTHALRRLEISRGLVEKVVQATLLLAVAISLYRVVILHEIRPGGINLVAIGYGFVVSVWVVFLFSQALERGRNAYWSFVIAAAGIFPVLATRSRIGLIILGVGCAVVALQWASRNGRWRALLFGSAAVVSTVATSVFLTTSDRYSALWNELVSILWDGSNRGGSVGMRYELNVAGLRAFWERPLFGHGFAEKMTQVHANTTPDGPDISHLTYVHNDYVTHLVAYGVFGLIFIFLCGFLIYRIIREAKIDSARWAGLALLAMAPVYMTADIVFNMDPVSGVATILLGLVLYTGTTPRDVPRFGANRE